MHPCFKIDKMTNGKRFRNYPFGLLVNGFWYEDSGKLRKNGKDMLKLYFALDRKNYFPYDVVKGKLTLKTKVPIGVNTLEIKICKAQKFEISENKRIVITNKKSEGSYEHCFTLLSDKEIHAGEHIFPFRFNIKGGEGASTALSGRFNDLHCHFENTYTIKARCAFDGREEISKIDLVVYNKSNEIPFMDTKIKMSTFLCLYKSVYLYRIVTDRHFYNSGDIINIKFFPTSIIKKSVISEIKVSLYEVFAYEGESGKIVRSRLFFDTKAIQTEKNKFHAGFRLPFGLSGTVNDGRFTVRASLFFSIFFYHGSPLKLRKYVDIGKPRITIPEIEEHFVFDGTCYNEALLEF